MDEVNIVNLNAELERQDRYLSHYGMTRVAVLPDKNCLFAAVCVAGELKMDLYDLRIATADHIAANMNDFHKFMSANQSSTLLDDMSDIAEELKMIRDGELWVGYETVMAISQYLDAAILVTSGGASDTDALRTDSFYFGEAQLKKRIHISWISMGFYDAIVPVVSTAGNPGLNKRRPVKTDLLELNRRHPSHVCQCKWSCNCKYWHEPYTFSEDVGQTPASAARPRSTESYSDSSADPNWQKVFHYLSEEAFVLQKWKFIMRHLLVQESKITEIDVDCKTLREKVTQAFQVWLTGYNKPGKPIQALQEALQQEKLTKVAEGLNEFI